MAFPSFTGVKVFSATMAENRRLLGDDFTAWLQAHPGREPVHVIVTQSSDERFHCLSIVLFWRDRNLTAAWRKQPQ